MSICEECHCESGHKAGCPHQEDLKCMNQGCREAIGNDEVVICHACHADGCIHCIPVDIEAVATCTDCQAYFIDELQQKVVDLQAVSKICGKLIERLVAIEDEYSLKVDDVVTEAETVLERVK